MQSSESAQRGAADLLQHVGKFLTQSNTSAGSPTSIDVPIHRLDPTVELPAYAYEGDAGLDLRASEDVVLHPFERRLISTGLAVAIPEGYAGFVMPRSGLALKQGLSMANTPGLIDAHYRGELKICAINLDPERDIEIRRGDRIAQLVIQQVPIVHLIEVEALDETDRGSGGFGSSGVAQ